jgi:hypothetical protein
MDQTMIYIFFLKYHFSICSLNTLFLFISVSIHIIDSTILIAKNRDHTSINKINENPRQTNKKLAYGHLRH